MSIKANVWVLVATATLGMGQPALAQQDNGQRLSPRQMEIYSEMWALAGVCLQYRGYDVQQDELAAFLNSRLDSASGGDRQRVAADKEDRLEAIRAEIERLQALPPGNRRAREEEETAAALMTRCTRLANHATAGEFFHRES